MNSSEKDLEEATPTPQNDGGNDNDTSSEADFVTYHPQHDQSNKSSTRSQKRAVFCAAFCLVLAITIFAVALTSSLKKPKQMGSEHQMISNEHLNKDKENNNKDDAVDDVIDHVPDYGGGEEWQWQQPPLEEEDAQVDVDTTEQPLELDTTETEQPVVVPVVPDEIIYTDNNDAAPANDVDQTAEASVEAEVPTAHVNEHEIIMYPEDCDNANCISLINHHSNSNNNSNNKNSSSTTGDYEEDLGDILDLPIFQGPISDFIVSNATRVNTLNSNSKRCPNPDEGVARFILDTDRYSWETSFAIVRLPNGKSFASGPPPGKKYDRSTRYIGTLCLPAGNYNLEMKDLMGDGLCCEHGRGNVKIVVNGKNVVESGSENYTVRRYGFSVVREEESNTGNGNVINGAAINNGQECSVVTPINYNTKFQHGANKYQSFTGYQCYRTVEGTKQTVTDLVSRYPTLTSKISLPYPTSEKGELLYALVITNKNFNPSTKNPNYGGKGKLLVVSGIHARELTTGETMTRFAEYLLQSYGVDPDVTWVLDFMEIHLILHGNPDGRKYLENGGDKGFWKKNRNNKSPSCNHWRYGVDPNRNFPFKWGQCVASDQQRCSSSSDCSSVVYRGPSPQSEQETKAILAYAKAKFPASQRKGNLGNLQQAVAQLNTPFGKDSEGVFLDVHSHGRYVGWPWGFKNEKTPDDYGLGALGRKFASFSGYRLWAPKMPNRVYGFDGSTIDTMYGWLGVASFFFELGTSFYQPCNTYPTVIREVFPALLYAAKVAKEPYKASRGPDILCTTITSTNKNDGKYINARIEVSDNKRTVHADDGGSIFATGNQFVRSVEIFVNCHPYSGSSCSAAARRNLPNAGKSTTVTMQFKAPVNRSNNVMYIRAIDSQQYTGPVTARKFVS